MNRAEFLKRFQKADLAKYLERRRSCFIYLAFAQAENEPLFQVSGFKFNTHFYYYRDEIGAMYRDKKESEVCNKYFLSLVASNDKRLFMWADQAGYYNKLADELIKKFSNAKNAELTLAEFEKYYKDFIDILLYGVTIPFLVLESIESGSENDKDKYKATIKIFWPLRNVSKYPELTESMIAYFWKLVATRDKIEDYKLLSLLSSKELIEASKGKKVDTRELEKRKNGCLIMVDHKDESAYFDFDLSLRDKLKSKDSINTNKLTGKVAFAGKAKGSVCIINNFEDMHKFKDGDIIVSISTNPSLMPILRKCSAIVTDEGGLMCHASITSRELKIPCVVGTKNATKILIDGDIIEVDANNGIVRKIKN